MLNNGEVGNPKMVYHGGIHSKRSYRPVCERGQQAESNTKKTCRCQVRPDVVYMSLCVAIGLSLSLISLNCSWPVHVTNNSAQEHIDVPRYVDRCIFTWPKSLSQLLIINGRVVFLKKQESLGNQTVAKTRTQEISRD